MTAIVYRSDPESQFSCSSDKNQGNNLHTRHALPDVELWNNQTKQTTSWDTLCCWDERQPRKYKSQQQRNKLHHEIHFAAEMSGNQGNIHLSNKGNKLHHEIHIAAEMCSNQGNIHLSNKGNKLHHEIHIAAEMCSNQGNLHLSNKGNKLHHEIHIAAEMCSNLGINYKVRFTLLLRCAATKETYISATKVTNYIVRYFVPEVCSNQGYKLHCEIHFVAKKGINQENYIHPLHF